MMTAGSFSGGAPRAGLRVRDRNGIPDFGDVVDEPDPPQGGNAQLPPCFMPLLVNVLAA